MTIIIGILVPAILFLITLPLQSFLFVARQSLKVKEKMEKKRSKGSFKNSLGFSSGSASLRARLGISNKKQSSSKLGGKFNTIKLKAQQQLIRTVSFLISFLRSLASSLICIAMSALMILLPMVIVVIVATSGIMMFLNTENGTLTFGNVTNVSSDTTSDFSGTASDIRYLQSNFLETITGGTTIAGGGCGWCSLTHMMTNLNPEKCGNMTPADWIPIMPDSVKNNWSSGGMGWDAPQAWVDALNTIGTYGQYELIHKNTQSSDNTAQILEEAKTYMHEKNTMMVLSTSSGLFTDGGHIILLNSVASDNSYFTVTDSSNKAYNYLLAGGESVTSDTMNSFHFPMTKTSLYGHSYNIKCCWVIKRVS